MKAVEEITSRIAVSISVWMSRYWAWRSRKGTVTPRHGCGGRFRLSPFR
jgi:hypothetical protein